ncbi:response regulator transcription factor [Nocardia wallacei]|uniref:response regulator transcription factor n=1 Tax=Nocardia wallacei TaxID=480035 RepID=UPI0024559E86|nr:response regulator [Nocardia wallacei]
MADSTGTPGRRKLRKRRFTGPDGRPGAQAGNPQHATESRPAEPSTDPQSGQAADPSSSTTQWWTIPPRDHRPIERTTAALPWVDDNPQNNALIVDRLKRNGIRVDLARTTDEALTLLDKRRTYGAIVSDWGRTEKGTRISNAGRRFAESARERGIDAPIIIYTSMFGPADTRREEALQAGATFVTGSTTQLLGELTTLGLLPA